EDGIRALYVTGVQTCALPISSGTARWRVRLHYGNRRHVGRIFTATSSCAAGETTPGKHRNDHSDSSRLRSFDTTGQHGCASVRKIGRASCRERVYIWEGAES